MCFCRAATNVLDILPQFVAHQCTQSSPCVSSAAKVSSWIDIKATCDKRFFFRVVTAFVAIIEVHTSTDSHSNESTLMRVAVPRGSTSTRGRQSRRVLRQRVVVKANTTCVDLWLFEHFSCEPSKENSVTSRKPLGPLQIVTPFGVHPRLSQLVCLLFDGLLFVRLRRMWELRVGEVLRSCDAVAKVYLFRVMFRDAARRRGVWTYPTFSDKFSN